MKQQIIKIIESHRPPMIHPTNRSGGEYAVACEVNRILDDVIRDVEYIEKEQKEILVRSLILGTFTGMSLGIFSGVVQRDFVSVIIMSVILLINCYFFITKCMSSKTRDKFKCKDCGHTLVRNRSRGTLYCGICKK